MGSKTAFVLALLGTAALAAAGVSLALCVTRPQREAFIVTRRVTESLTPDRHAGTRQPRPACTESRWTSPLAVGGATPGYVRQRRVLPPLRGRRRKVRHAIHRRLLQRIVDLHVRRSQLRLDDPGRAPPAKVELSAVRSPEWSSTGLLAAVTESGSTPPSGMRPARTSFFSASPPEAPSAAQLSRRRHYLKRAPRSVEEVQDARDRQQPP
jgi:hypothetical protein